MPGLAAVTICSPAGGVLQGDRLSIEVMVDAGAQLRLETQSATRLYAMPNASASALVKLRVGRDAYLEYVPDPLIPYANSSYRQESVWGVDESATLVVGEVIAAGREARGERAGYRGIESNIDARRPEGQTLFTDACVLEPNGAQQLGFLGDYTALGSLFVVSPRFDAASFARLAEHPAVMHGHAGWSDLPNHAGAWFKILAPDSATAATAVRAAWECARRALLSLGLPPTRRF
jgi:urease accessory protein